MLTFDEVYRGYRISYQRGNRFAWIFPPGSLFALETIPSATRAEGFTILKARAHALVDAEIARGS